MSGIDRLILPLALCVLTFSTTAQLTEGGGFSGMEPSALSANKLLSVARNAERVGDIYTAILYYEAYLIKKPKNHGVKWDLAGLNEQARNYDRAMELYEDLDVKEPERYRMLPFEKASILMRLQRYDEAKLEYDRFIDAYKGAKDYRDYKKVVKRMMFACDSAQFLLDEPLNVVIEKAGFNSPHTDHAPTPMGDQLLYTALPMKEVEYFHIDSVRPKKRFYVSGDDGAIGEWSPELFFDDKDYSNGVFNADGSRFYYSECAADWRGEYHCELRLRKRENGKWGPEELLESINMDGYTSTMPAVGIEAEKGREILYFVSDRPEGKGGRDIWYSVYNERKDEYKAPRNAGKRVNTPLDEVTPYYNDVERRLYFSSDGLGGLGGLDVFYTRGEMRKYTDAVNVGYPINGGLDELYYVLNPDRKSGYMVSNRSKTDQLLHAYCCDDIYSFDYPDHLTLGIGGFVMEIDDSLYFQGKGEELDFNTSMNSGVLDGAEARLFLKEENGEETLMKRMMTDDVGTYFFDLEEGKEYRVEVNKEGYFRNHIDISTIGRSASDTTFHNFGMSEITDKDIRIDDILFDFGSNELNESSILAIQRSILPVLKENPEYDIEISAHTDDVGQESANKSLSQRRAESVVDYLIQEGIERTRLQAKGYGESRPVAANSRPDGSDDPDGRQRNRRVEMKMILAGGE